MDSECLFYQGTMDPLPEEEKNVAWTGLSWLPSFLKEITVNLV